MLSFFFFFNSHSSFMSPLSFQLFILVSFSLHYPFLGQYLPLLFSPANILFLFTLHPYFFSRLLFLPRHPSPLFLSKFLLSLFFFFFTQLLVHFFSPLAAFFVILFSPHSEFLPSLFFQLLVRLSSSSCSLLFSSYSKFLPSPSSAPFILLSFSAWRWVMAQNGGLYVMMALPINHIERMAVLVTGR